MCGILGQISFKDTKEWDLDLFDQSLSLLKHRGPDASGRMVENDFIFGHRRLKIIDLSNSANQPMSTEDNKVTVIFNGEIYNFNHLKKELIKKKCYL